MLLTEFVDDATFEALRPDRQRPRREKVSPMTSSMNYIRVSSNHLAALLVAFLVASCATIQNGGAPEPAFNYDKDLKDLEEMFAPAASIAAMGPHPTQEVRNNFIDGRLALYN